MMYVCMYVSDSYSQDSPEQTKKIIMDMFDKINQKDVNGSFKNIDAACVDHTPFVPNQKPGIDGFKQIFDVLYKAFPDFNQTINDIIISQDGKKVSVLETITGTNSGEFMGMPTTNKKIQILGIDNFHIENGKLTDHWGFVDDQTMSQQLGMTK